MKNIILFLFFLNFAILHTMEFPIDDRNPQFVQLVKYSSQFKKEDAKAIALEIQKSPNVTHQQKVRALALMYSAAYKDDCEALHTIGTELWVGKQLRQDTPLAGEIFNSLARNNVSNSNTTYALWLLHQPTRTEAANSEIKKLLLQGLKKQTALVIKKSIEYTPEISDEKNFSICKELVVLYMELLQEILNDTLAKKITSDDAKKAIENVFRALEQIEPTAHIEALLQCADFMRFNTISINTITVESLSEEAFSLFYSYPSMLLPRLKKLGIKKVHLLVKVINQRLTDSFNNKKVNIIAGLLALRFMLIIELTFDDLIKPIKKYIAHKRKLKHQFTKKERPYFEILAYSQTLQLKLVNNIPITQHIQEILDSTKNNPALGYTPLPSGQEFLQFYKKKFAPKKPASDAPNSCFLKAFALDLKSCLAAHDEFYRRYTNNIGEPVMGLSLAYAFLLLAMDSGPTALQKLGDFYIRHPDLEKLATLGIQHCTAASLEAFNYIGSYARYHCLHHNNAQALKDFLHEQATLKISIRETLVRYAYCAMVIFQCSHNEADLLLAMKFFLPLLSLVEKEIDDDGLYLVIFGCKKIVELSLLEKAQPWFKFINDRIEQKPFLVKRMQKIAPMLDDSMKSLKESRKKVMQQAAQ